MHTEKDGLPYYFEGSLYTPQGDIIEEPTILVTKDDIFCKYGNYEIVMAEYERRVLAYTSAGFEEEANNLIVISFKTFEGISMESVTYILRRMISFSASGFVFRFLKEFSNPTNFISWLNNEMLEVPLSISRY